MILSRFTQNPEYRAMEQHPDGDWTPFESANAEIDRLRGAIEGAYANMPECEARTALLSALDPKGGE